LFQGVELLLPERFVFDEPAPGIAKRFPRQLTEGDAADFPAGDQS
jgi:hypothetical protein